MNTSRINSAALPPECFLHLPHPHTIPYFPCLCYLRAQLPRLLTYCCPRQVSFQARPDREAASSPIIITWLISLLLSLEPADRGTSPHFPPAENPPLISHNYLQLSTSLQTQSIAGLRFYIIHLQNGISSLRLEIVPPCLLSSLHSPHSDWDFEVPALWRGTHANSDCTTTGQGNSIRTSSETRTSNLWS